MCATVLTAFVFFAFAVKSPKTPGEGRKRKEPEGPVMYVKAEKAWINEHKEAAKKAKPDAESKDLTKELKAQYEALTDDEKQPYKDAAQKDKQRYEEECKEAGVETVDEKKAKVSAEKAVEKAAKDKVKDSEKEAKQAAKSQEKVEKEEAKAKAEAKKGPKNPLSGYMLFTNAKRKEFTAECQAACKEGEKAQIGDIAKLMGAAWKKADDKEKAPFQEEAKELKAAFKIAVVEHEKKRKAEEAADKVAEEAAAEAEVAADAEQVLQKAKDLSTDGDSSWFEEYLTAAENIECMSEIAPGENGVQQFFNDLLNYDVSTLEGAVGGMAGSADGDQGEAFKLVIACCNDLIARHGVNGTGAAPAKPEAEEAEAVVKEVDTSMEVEEQEEEAMAEAEEEQEEQEEEEEEEAAPVEEVELPAWAEESIAAAVSEHESEEMTAEGIRANFVQTYSAALGGYLQMKGGIEDAAEETRAYFQKLIDFALKVVMDGWKKEAESVDSEALEQMQNGETLETHLGTILGYDLEMLQGGLKGMKEAKEEAEEGMKEALTFTIKIIEEIIAAQSAEGEEEEEEDA